jgi:hypothetical protein
LGHSSASVVDAGGCCWDSLSKRMGEELIPQRRNNDEGDEVDDGRRRRRIVVVGYNNLDEDDVERDKDP